MKPRCNACNLPGRRQSFRNANSWKRSPYYICPKCLKIVNIEYTNGQIRLIEPPTPTTDPAEAEVIESIKTETKIFDDPETSEIDWS